MGNRFSTDYSVTVGSGVLGPNIPLAMLINPWKFQVFLLKIRKFLLRKTVLLTGFLNSWNQWGQTPVLLMSKKSPLSWIMFSLCYSEFKSFRLLPTSFFTRPSSVCLSNITNKTPRLTDLFAGTQLQNNLVQVVVRRARQLRVRGDVHVRARSRRAARQRWQGPEGRHGAAGTRFQEDENLESDV